MVFNPLLLLEKFFLGGSGWILAYKAYIHYGPWLLCPDEPLKHLFMASGSLQKAQNRLQNGKFSWFSTPYTFWEAFFWVDLGGSLPLKPISILNLGYCDQMNP